MVDLLQHFVRKIESGQRPMVSKLGAVEMLVVGLQNTEDSPIHLGIHAVVRAEKAAILIFDKELTGRTRRVSRLGHAG